MTIKIDKTMPEAGDAPLFVQYGGQTQPQPAYLELDEFGNVSLDYSSEIGGAVPMDVWHGRTLRWSVSPYLSRDAALDLLEDASLVALLERVHAGHSVDWDGSNMVGHLTEDAREAKQKVQEILDEISRDGAAQVWDAYDWVFAFGKNSLRGVWPEDEPLDDAEERLEEIADLDGVVLDGSVRDALLSHLEGEDPDELEGEHLAAYRKYVLGEE
ncbi:MAG: hypothetical protein D6800_09985 [Candidatus Zixiibacteriota bacterium]|nr:MAG: hypothetical protein D6800_09985 [candidate division Zixibacteria bacterium]